MASFMPPNRSAAKEEIQYLNFNQESNCVAIATSRGYRVFNCSALERNVYATDGSIGIIEMLFSSSLLALVGGGGNPAFSPRRLKLWNTQHGSAICELDFDTRILSVKLNRTTLVVALQSKVHIYDLNSMRSAHVLDCVSTAPPGVCALTSDPRHCYLALPTGVVSGDLLLYDAKNLEVLNVFRAHKSPLSCLCFSRDGTLLATASTSGTVIRVFSVPSGEKLCVFRRGISAAEIHCMAFDPTNTWLGVTSSSLTAHVFKVSRSVSRSLNTSGGASAVGGSSASNGVSSRSTDNSVGMSAARVAEVGTAQVGETIARGVKGVSEMLPGSLQELVEPERSFSSAKLDCPNGTMTKCAISDDLLQVATSTGMYYEYSIAPKELISIRSVSFM